LIGRHLVKYYFIIGNTGGLGPASELVFSIAVASLYKFTHSMFIAQFFIFPSNMAQSLARQDDLKNGHDFPFTLSMTFLETAG